MAGIEWRMNGFVGTVDGFLTDDECREYVSHGEENGFEEATITTSTGGMMRKDVRNNDRAIIDAPARAERLFRRLAAALDLSTRLREGREVVGLNERLRLYRYDVGQKFDWHRDGYFARENGERSLFTFMVYLNEDFEGGATSFKTMAGSFEVVPRTGMALLFWHPLEHRGDEVTKGRKYVLRSDLMFSGELQP